MTPTFFIRASTNAERLLRKLNQKHPELADISKRAEVILRTDPYNRSRSHAIKKLENVAAGDGQYRLRIGRFRFRFDITGQVVTLHSVSLRREDTYRN